MKIRPRIFLEGNWFVELQPGSPSAKTLSSGSTIPITQTSDPVQLDQVLDALNTDTRANLQNFLAGYGDALTRKPTAAENAEQDPDVHGLNAAQALNKSYHRGPSALRGSAIVHQAIERHRSRRPLPAGREHRQSDGGAERARAGSERTVRQLQRVLPQLRRASPRACTPRSRCCRARCAAIGRGFAALDAAFPSIRTFSLDLIPGVKLLPSTIAASLPWIEQVQASLAPSELGGVAKGLLTATPALAKLFSEQPAFFEADRTHSASV